MKEEGVGELRLNFHDIMVLGISQWRKLGGAGWGGRPPKMFSVGSIFDSVGSIFAVGSIWLTSTEPKMAEFFSCRVNIYNKYVSKEKS